MNDASETVNLAREEAYMKVVAGLTQQLAAGWKEAIPDEIPMTDH